MTFLIQKPTKEKLRLLHQLEQLHLLQQFLHQQELYLLQPLDLRGQLPLARHLLIICAHLFILGYI
jgi:hypothetical protein